MLITQVALVPYPDDVVKTDELLRVSAALQVQLTRDFAPIWNIPAVVSPFASLDHVPSGYLPLVIVEPDKLVNKVHGFHIVEDGLPLGLVEYRPPDWSLAASHELIEMLCDPWGNRVVYGPALADSRGRVLRADQDAPRVEYLLEACDPCEKSWYSIDGVAVSDFVTPAYYGAREGTGGRYSFSGKIAAPRELLEDGYITWFTRGPTREIWQGFGQKGKAPKVERLGSENACFSREWVDARTAASAPAKPRTAAQANKAIKLANDAAAAYGAVVKGEVMRLLAEFNQDRQYDAADVIALVEKLAKDKKFYERFTDDDSFRRSELRKRNIPNIDFGDAAPSQDRYESVHQSLRAMRSRLACGTPGQPDDFLTLAIHATLV